MATPILTLIETELQTLLAGLRVANGYQLNWSPVNLEDRALEDYDNYNCFSCVYWQSEENHDNVNMVHAGAYSNKSTYTIESRVPLLSESVKPKFDARSRLYMAQEDIKRLFGNFQTLNSTYASNVQYLDSSIIDDTYQRGDRFTPIMLKTTIEVWYFQSRINPSIVVN